MAVRVVNTKRDMRGWMLAHCPDLLGMLEACATARRLRRRDDPTAPTADLDNRERELWTMVARTPGWAGTARVDGGEET
jgi:hypothetical protein